MLGQIQQQKEGGKEKGRITLHSNEYQSMKARGEKKKLDEVYEHFKKGHLLLRFLPRKSEIQEVDQE